MKFGLNTVAPAGASGYGSRATPPPMNLFVTTAPMIDNSESEKRGLTWLLRALRESYERLF